MIDGVPYAYWEENDGEEQTGRGGEEDIPGRNWELLMTLMVDGEEGEEEERGRH